MENEFKYYYNNYYLDVVRLVYSYTLNILDSEDITQSTFTKLYNYMLKNDIKTDYVKQWLFRCAINESKNLLKSSWRKLSKPLDDYEYCISIKENELKNEVFDALRKVQHKYRIPLFLYYYEGYNIKEIAKLLNSNESTIKTRLKRGKDLLAKEMNT